MFNTVNSLNLEGCYCTCLINLFLEIFVRNLKGFRCLAAKPFFIEKVNIIRHNSYFIPTFGE
jgi:hypothetical protein